PDRSERLPQTSPMIALHHSDCSEGNIVLGYRILLEHRPGPTISDSIGQHGANGHDVSNFAVLYFKYLCDRHAARSRRVAVADASVFQLYGENTSVVEIVHAPRDTSFFIHDGRTPRANIVDGLQHA